VLLEEIGLAVQEQEAMELLIVSHSHAQTQQLGMRLGELLRGGELLLLEGPLGMGKTTITQGLARGMGITDTINSPTFTLLKEYSGHQLDPLVPAHSSPLDMSPASQQGFTGKRSKRAARSVRGPALYHFDLYRLEDPEEIFALGFDDYFSDPSGVCVVEWADRAEGLWPRERLGILLHILSETERGLTFTAYGTRYHELLQQFQKSAYATTGS
jgi:tRNA threonylcarbamoyladenosine biosynthesis protein TsaE